MVELHIEAKKANPTLKIANPTLKIAKFALNIAQKENLAEVLARVLPVWESEVLNKPQARSINPKPGILPLNCCPSGSGRSSINPEPRTPTP